MGLFTFSAEKDGAAFHTPLALVLLARRRRIFRKVDLEQARVDLLGGVEIIDRYRGVVALRIGYLTCWPSAEAG